LTEEIWMLMPIQCCLMLWRKQREKEWWKARVAALHKLLKIPSPPYVGSLDFNSILKEVNEEAEGKEDVMNVLLKGKDGKEGAEAELEKVETKLKESRMEFDAMLGRSLELFSPLTVYPRVIPGMID
jgi:hypothetical protein